jgi:uncharacterized damage-inducible protein DinB
MNSEFEDLQIKNNSMPLPASAQTRLQYQHETIAELTKDISEEQLKKRIHAGKWSAFENIVHLCAYQPTFIFRIERMLKEEGPLFERYVAENDDNFYECLKLSLSALISQINNDRAGIISNLKDLDKIQLNRTGSHPKYGLLKLSQWIDFFLLHEAHHLWTIMQLVFLVPDLLKDYYYF